MPWPVVLSGAEEDAEQEEQQVAVGREQRAQLYQVEIKFGDAVGSGAERSGVSSGCGNLRCNCREEAPNQDVVARGGLENSTTRATHTHTHSESLLFSLCAHFTQPSVLFIFISAFFSQLQRETSFPCFGFSFLPASVLAINPRCKQLLLLLLPAI